jgi:hypothetical protein
MSEPIKPAGWLVLDPEGGYEYGCMDPDYGRDFCHDHIKDAQESGIPRARKWVVRESFSRDQVEQNAAELRAEVERLRAELAAREQAMLALDHRAQENLAKWAEARAELARLTTLRPACEHDGGAEVFWWGDGEFRYIGKEGDDWLCWTPLPDVKEPTP